MKLDLKSFLIGALSVVCLVLLTGAKQDRYKVDTGSESSDRFFERMWYKLKNHDEVVRVGIGNDLSATQMTVHTNLKYLLAIDEAINEMDSNLRNRTYNVNADCE